MILQINEAIAIQGNGRHSLSMGEDHQSRWTGSMKVSRYSLSASTEKAVVLSKNGKHRRLSTGSITQEENSRRQLLKVLDSRKTVLRKEQGMAFARAVAAGFDVDHMANLILFAKSFGASRLLEACLKFVELWKAKHKSEQWLEVVGAEAVPYQSEFVSMKEKQFSEVWPVSSDNLATGNSEIDNYTSASNAGDERLGSVPKYDHGHVQNVMIPQWASHGPPVSQSYPVQSMSYYQSYPVNGSGFQSPYAPIDDPGLRIKTSLKESENGVYQNNKESRKSRKKVRNSRKIQSDTSEGSKSRSESQSASDIGYEEEIQDLQSNTPSRKHQSSSKSIRTANIVEKDPVVDKGGDAGNWQTFQKLLLRIQRESTSADRDMFSNEEAQPKRRQNKNPTDPSTPPTRNNSDLQDLRMVGCDNESRRTGYCKFNNDDLMISEQMKQVSNNNPISNEYQNSSHLHKSSLYNASDESFIVPCRSGLHEEPTKEKRSVIEMNSDIHLARKNKDNSHGNKDCQSYEPHDLNLMPDRGFEWKSHGFDPAKDFDMQISTRNFIKKESISQKDVSKRAREELKGLISKKTAPMTIRGKSSKLNPLADAKARAEKIRAFKANLQKVKKEKEEEEKKRLEALKRERQKRITARSSSNVANSTLSAPLPKLKKPISQSPSTPNISKFGNSTPKSSSPLRKMPRSSKSPSSPMQTRASLTPKPSPLSYKGSKFSDDQPSNLSPLVKLLRSNKTIAQSTSKSQETTVQRRIRLSPSPSSSFSKGSKFSDSHEVTKVNRSNGLRQSATPVSRPSEIQAKRVSDPKARKSSPGSSVRRISSSQQQKETMMSKSQVKSKPATSRSRTGASKEACGEIKKNQSKTSISNNEDDPIVEKAVVILENKTTAAPITRASDAKNGVSSCKDGRIEEIELASELQNSVEVVNVPKVVSQKLSNFPVTKKPDQDPFARALHREKSTIRSLEHVGEHIGQKEATIGSERNRHTCKSMESISLVQIHEIHEKPLVRGSPKGIKEVLKFRRKGQSSASGEPNSDTSNNVPTLKDLISKEDHSLSTPPKASRTFSLFSPFQHKSTEKKAAARGLIRGDVYPQIFWGVPLCIWQFL
ncbi:uncharacterized protein A4U43_C01F18660 [Asparagus officinalis]|uniref:Uncharacterized protein n=1 Tax=Asparagus officinalis TaxID=4686 RepID=A0A5P1FQE1_ASPOF|nr:uncharacterized protein A4U43_C01F18660 [Asparagus officinalis]